VIAAVEVGILCLAAVGRTRLILIIIVEEEKEKK